MDQSKFISVVLFSLMLTSVFGVYFWFDAPYSLNLGFENWLLISFLETNKVALEFHNFFTWPLIVFNNGLIKVGIEHFTIVFLKVANCLVLCGVLYSYSSLLVKFKNDITLIYLIIPVLISTVFVGAGLSFSIYLLLALSLTNGTSSLKTPTQTLTFGFLLLSCAFISWKLTLLLLPLLLVRLLTVCRGLALLSSLAIVVLCLVMVLLSLPNPDEALNLSVPSGIDLIGLFNSVLISDDFDKLKYLLPLLFLISPLFIGYRPVRTIWPWFLLLYLVFVYVVLPKHAFNGTYLGFELICLPLLLFPFLFKRVKDVRKLSWSYAFIICTLFIVSYVNESQKYNNDIEKLSNLELEPYTSVSYLNKGFNGLFYLNVGKVFWNFETDPELGLLSESRFFDGKRFSEVFSSRPEQMLLESFSILNSELTTSHLIYSCGGNIPHFLELRLIRKNGCWNLMKSD